MGYYLINIYTEYALEQIGLLYEVEREADDKNLSYNTAMTSITV